MWNKVIAIWVGSTKHQVLLTMPWHSVDEFRTVLANERNRIREAIEELYARLKKTMGVEEVQGFTLQGQITAASGDAENMVSNMQMLHPNKEPTVFEREAHASAGHAVFISWCRHCVRGRGREAAHSSRSRPETAIPVFSWDYCHFSSKKGASGEGTPSSTPAEATSTESPVLVNWDSKSKGPSAISSQRRAASSKALFRC